MNEQRLIAAHSLDAGPDARWRPTSRSSPARATTSISRPTSSSSRCSRPASTCCSATPASCPSATPPTSASAPMSAASSWATSACRSCWPSLLGGIGGALFAALFGFFCVRLTTIYFSMLTLAFAQIVWAICFKWNEVTGGEQGYPRVPMPDMAVPGLAARSSAPCAGRRRSSIFVALVLCGALHRADAAHHRSPFGRILNTIRDNPERAQFIGIDVRRYQLDAFIDRRRLRGPRRRPLRHLQARRLSRLRLLDQVGRGADHDASSAASTTSGGRRSAPRC